MCIMENITKSLVICLATLFFLSILVNGQMHYCQKIQSESLRKISFDQKLNRLFVASTNKVLELHPNNFSIINEQALMQKLESGDCVGDPGCDVTSGQQDFNAQVLLVDAENMNLIVCGSAKMGSCFKIALDGLTPTNNEIQWVVSTDEKDRVHGNIYGHLTESVQQVIIGNSVSPKAGGQQSQLKFVYGFEPSTFETDISLQYSEQFLMDFLSVDVVGSFKHKGYTFLVINRQNARDGDRVPYLVRICDRNPTSESLVEVRLGCSADGRTDTPFVAVGLEKTFLSDELAKVQRIVAEDVLFVLFGNKTSSAICVYSLDEIMLAFKNVVEGCSRGQAGFERGVFYVTGEPSRPCQPVTSSVNPRNFCGENPLNFAMGSSSTTIRNMAIASYFPLDVVTTSFLVTVVNEYNVAFVATDRQSVIKVKMPSSPQTPSVSSSSSSSHVEFVLPLESQILEMAFDGSEGFFVVGEKSMCYMKRAVCNHTTCESCIVDPYCGWCLETKKCTQKASCPNQGLWMSDKCPTVLNLVPRNIPVNDFRNAKIRMEVSNVPKNYRKGYCNISVVPDPVKPTPYYSKQVDIFKVDLSQPNSLGFICKEFNDRPNLLNGKAFATMTLTIVLDNVDWASDDLYIYDCRNFKSCSSCVSEEKRFPCNWCVDSLTCIPDDDQKCNLRPFADADNPLAKKSSECPSVDSCNSTQVFASGSSVSYQMMGRNIKEHYKSGLSCRFGMDSAADQPLASILPSGNLCNIFCSQTMLKYEAPKPFQVVNVDLMVDSNSVDPKVIDNPNNVTLTLFKCRYMESSCGKCLLLDPTFECIWCKQGEFCSSKSDCPSDYLDKGSICPNPTITSFQPVGGPVLGGTRLTIRGTNLGMSANQVQVTLGLRECKVLPELYQPTEVIVCNTSSAIRPEMSKVEVKVNNLHRCTSSTDFQYKNPQLKDFKPNRGMKSGGTLVSILGENLDFGSRYVVTIGDKRSTVVSRNATHLLVVTGENSIPKKVSVKVKVDNFDMEPLPMKFEYLNNPDITGVRPKSSLLSGGRQLTVTGRSFEIIRNAQLVSTFAFTNFTTACTVKSSTMMTCPSPDMRDLEHYFNDQTSNSVPMGFVLDNVSFPFGKDYLMYYYNPIIKKFNGVHEVKDSYQDVCIETEKSEWLSEFLSDIKVKVGSVNCSHSSFGADTNSICFKPVECPVKHQGEREYPVKVVINNYSEEVGLIKYPVPFRSGLIVGLILGLLIPVIIGAIIFVFWYARRMKRLNIKKREGRMLTTNQPSSQVNRYAGEPATSAEESIPLTEVVDPNSFQDDAQYLEALINRLDNQNRNAAKEVYIARERLEIGNQLGKGHFGCVYAATLRDAELRNPMPVAVKTIDDTDLDQKMMEAFLKEGIVMKNFNHPHVLSLLGLCLGYKKEPMVILPFMANGDLRSYIKVKNRSFTARQLLQLAQQVAEGMSYLASLNFIHRDLAARNCMIDDKSQVKVADFGLSHELHDREYYSSRNRRAKLPIKWMALESLENYVFTIKSDVWSFGVLLWELMTRGTTPYPDVDVFETRNFLASGRRLHKPKFCPDNVYAVMTDCWQESPERRPTFTDLVNRIELLLNPPRHNPSSDKNAGSYVNIPSHDPIQDYLKPISSLPEDERNQQESGVPNQSGDSGNDDDTSSLSSHGSDESIKAPKVLLKAGVGVKEASV